VVVLRSDTPLDGGDEVVALVRAQCGDDEIRTLLLQGPLTTPRRAHGRGTFPNRPGTEGVNLAIILI